METHVLHFCTTRKGLLALAHNQLERASLKPDTVAVQKSNLDDLIIARGFKATRRVIEGIDRAIGSNRYACGGRPATSTSY